MVDKNALKKEPEDEEMEVDVKTEADTDSVKAEASVSPPETEKPINPFFLSSKKELKVQSAGEGLKGANYSPDKAPHKYDPIKDAFWQHGEKLVFC